MTIAINSSLSSNFTGYPYYSFVQQFEEVDPNVFLRWFDNYWHYSLYLTVFYLVSIYGLKEFMKHRKPMNIRKAVMMWDALLAAFSICGMVRGIPEMIYILINYGMEFSVCSNVANSVSMFWAWAYVISKAPELLDTLFLVLRKQELTLLHVAHHALTLIFTWRCSIYLPAAGRWLITLNYSVHAFMYTYFTLKAAKVNIPVQISMIITASQILQMITCLLASGYALTVKLLGHECQTPTYIALAGLAFGLFLLYLFVSFFVVRYKYVKTNIEKKMD